MKTYFVSFSAVVPANSKDEAIDIAKSQMESGDVSAEVEEIQGIYGPYQYQFKKQPT